jgi:hypothetical protein
MRSFATFFHEIMIYSGARPQVCASFSQSERLALIHRRIIDAAANQLADLLERHSFQIFRWSSPVTSSGEPGLESLVDRVRAIIHDRSPVQLQCLSAQDAE